MLYSPVNSTINLEQRTYLSEVKGFKELPFPIANREQDIENLLQQIAYANSPNFAIIGDPGIGKTMGLHYILDVLTGKRKLPKGHKWGGTFNTIKEKLQNFQARDFLFLPNLQDPYRPVVIDFVDEGIGLAKKVVEAFSDDLVGLTKEFRGHEKINPYFEREAFERYVDISVRQIYQNLIGRCKILTNKHAKFTVKPVGNFSNFEISYKFLERRVNWDTIRKEMGMEVSRRRTRDKKKVRVTKKNVKKHLTEMLKQDAQLEVTQLFSVVRDAVVPEYPLEDKQEFLEQTMQAVQKEYEEVSALFLKGYMPYYRELRRRKIVEVPQLRIDPKSIDWMLGEFRGIFAAYEKKANPRIREWMDATIRYFEENRTEVNEALLFIYRGKTRKKKKKDEEMKPSHPFIEGHETQFCIPHGGDHLALHDILYPEEFDIGRKEGLSIKYPQSFSSTEMWGRVLTKEERKDTQEDGEEKLIPPHSCFTPGYLMEASVLVLVDNMQGFFKALLGTEAKDAAARRQTMLTYVEEGKLMIEGNGITFNINSPTMIIGCDNDRPYVKFDAIDSTKYSYDEGMASRFVTSMWNNTIENTPTSRRGTIGVIHKSIAEFNEEHDSRLHMAPEVIDRLLVDFSDFASVRLDYRTLRDEVRELLGFVRSGRGEGEFTLDDLIAFNKKHDNDERFACMVSTFEDMIQDPPETGVGMVHGVVLRGDVSGDLFPIRSGVIMDQPNNLEAAFQQYDTEIGITNESTHKGFLEAVDFLRRQIDAPIQFISRTTFHRSNESISGDSASLAIAVALCSSFSTTPIYSHTVYTGTVSFLDGTVGPIGGVYDKAVALWKAQELLKARGIDRRLRFVFPLENYRELRHNLAVSPYPVADGLDLIPVQDFFQAFHLGANKGDIDMKELNDQGEKMKKTLVDKMRENVTKWNKKVAISLNGEMHQDA